MLILKHVGHKIGDPGELQSLLSHLGETTSRVDGVELKEIYFPKGKAEFVLALDCLSEEQYLEWRRICPPPPGAEDWYEVYSLEKNTSRDSLAPYDHAPF